jgi:hypothetical protein
MCDQCWSRSAGIFMLFDLDLYWSHLGLKILMNLKANSANPDQTAQMIWIYTVPPCKKRCFYRVKGETGFPLYKQSWALQTKASVWTVFYDSVPFIITFRFSSLCSKSGREKCSGKARFSCNLVTFLVIHLYTLSGFTWNSLNTNLLHAHVLLLVNIIKSNRAFLVKTKFLFLVTITLTLVRTLSRNPK